MKAMLTGAFIFGALHPAVAGSPPIPHTPTYDSNAFCAAKRDISGNLVATSPLALNICRNDEARMREMLQMEWGAYKEADLTFCTERAATVAKEEQIAGGGSYSVVLLCLHERFAAGARLRRDEE